MSKATFRFSISLLMASLQKWLPFLSSIRRASATLFGTSMPYLCDIFRTRALTEAMILSRRRRVYGTHQQKAGSRSMLRDTANSATSTGLDSLSMFKGIHSSSPIFHCTNNFHPAVVRRIRRVPLLVVMYISALSKA